MRVYDWMKLYEAAVLETDFTKRPERVAKALEAIRQRLAEGSAANDAAELAALDKTLAALTILEAEVLPQKPYDSLRVEEREAASQKTCPD